MTAAIPFDQVVWDAEDIGAYLKVSKAHVLQCVRFAVGFPPPVPPKEYTAKGKTRKMDDQWQALAVTSWRLGATK